MIDATYFNQSAPRCTDPSRDELALAGVTPAGGDRLRDDGDACQQRLDVLYRVLQHNLRNRMSAILNYADVIEAVATDDAVADAAETIREIGWEVTSLSQKARQIENAIEGDPDRKSIEVTEIVSEVIADLCEEYPDVDVTTSLPGAARALAIPSLRLAIEEICENACEHNDNANPKVEVAVASFGPDDGNRKPDGSDTADEGNGWVRITVADDGPGIPEQDRTAIREGRETDLVHGSGLGLWLTYWIVDSSGGSLRFADDEPRGSVVIVDIPRASPTVVDCNDCVGPAMIDWNDCAGHRT